MIPPIDLVVTESDGADQLDALIGAVGFESRSCFVPLQWAPRADRLFASAFDTYKTLSYHENLRKLSDVGFDISEHRNSEIREWLRTSIGAIDKRSNQPLRLAVDVSSFTRSRLAQIVLGLIDIGGSRSVLIDFAYAPATYQPYVDSDAAIEVFEPVAPEFAGWSNDPDAPTTCVIGLGYEPERAVGVLEFLEPVGTWAFTPSGTDERYDRSLEKANISVWESTPPPLQVNYLVSQPLWTFTQLESLVFGLKGATRPVLVPFGPKIFAVLCLLAAVIHRPSVALWRAGGGPFEEPVDREPNGSIFAIRASVFPRGTETIAGAGASAIAT